MKFSAIIATTLAAVASAHPPSLACKPGTYSCTLDISGWRACNTSGQWVFAGNCPPETVCKFLASNGSPYCVPPKFNL